MDGGAWWAIVHGVANSRTGLSDFTFFQEEKIHFKKLTKETTQSHAGLGATISCNFASLNRMKTEQSLHVCGIFYHCLLTAKMYVNIK